MNHALAVRDASRLLLLVAGLLAGLAITLTTSGLSWQNGALGLGLALAALVGLSQTCSA